MHNLVREAGVTLSAFTCSFISDAELCCGTSVNSQRSCGAGNPEPTPAPQTGAFAPCPRRFLLGCPPAVAWLAARTEAPMELAMRRAFSPPPGSRARRKPWLFYCTTTVRCKSRTNS